MRRLKDRTNTRVTIKSTWPRTGRGGLPNRPLPRLQCPVGSDRMDVTGASGFGHSIASGGIGIDKEARYSYHHNELGARQQHLTEEAPTTHSYMRQHTPCACI